MINVFVVVFQDNPGGYGMPMHVKCSVHQSSSLSEELLTEMVRSGNASVT